MAFVESLDAFLVLKADGGLADAGTYDGATAVAVLFDRAYLPTLGMRSTDPTAMGKASDFVSPVGKTLVIGGVTFRIRNSEPQDDGAFVLLELEAQ